MLRNNNEQKYKGKERMVFSIFDRFKRYFSIGVLNTALHWCVFFAAYYWLAFDQAVSNLIAFLVAVTFSFFMNARYTFRSQATGFRYLLFILFMGVLSFATGYLADKVMVAPLVTVLLFSIISLSVGFIYSNYIVFRSSN